MNIGIFDSGIGGLSVFKEVIKLLPQYNYVYLADNAHVPYGGRPNEEIYHLTINAIDFLRSKDCQLIILACNTATTTSLRRIQQEGYKNILGVTRPTMEMALLQSPKAIGVIATEATVNSQSFPIELKKIGVDVPIYQQACPKLVPLIESSAPFEQIEPILRDYLQPLLDKHIDMLILGCTHYGLISTQIKRIVGSRINIIGEGKETAIKLKDYLKRHQEIEIHLMKNNKREYFITKNNANYPKLFRKIINNEDIELTQCTI